MKLSIRKYNLMQEEWDDFIFNQSVNGTMLQSRMFLNYHPIGRFIDASILIYDSDKLIAIFPGCEVVDEGKKTFYSHPGSSYGDIIVSKDMLRLGKASELLKNIEEYLYKEGFERVIIKQTSSVICKESLSSYEYVFALNHYTDYKEVNVYINYEDYENDILSNFSKMKKRNVKKALTAGLELKKLDSKDEIKEFHNILSKNLLKYDREPVHSTDELWDLYNRLGEHIEFYGALKDGVITAGTMVFLFEDVKCAHTQYLCADSDYQEINPMTFIYYKMIEKYKKRNYKKLSWGIVSEHLGEELNWGLANNKEEFGGTHSINHVYIKDLT